MTYVFDALKQFLIFSSIYVGLNLLAQETFAADSNDLGLRSSIQKGIHSSEIEAMQLEQKKFRLTSNPECIQDHLCQQELTEVTSELRSLRSQVREAKTILSALSGQFLSPRILWDLSDAYLDGGQVAVTCRQGKYYEFLHEMDCIPHTEVSTEMAVLGDTIEKRLKDDTHGTSNRVTYSSQPRQAFFRTTMAN